MKRGKNETLLMAAAEPVVTKNIPLQFAVAKVEENVIKRMRRMMTTMKLKSVKKTYAFWPSKRLNPESAMVPSVILMQQLQLLQQRRGKVHGQNHKNQHRQVFPRTSVI
jgi:hypothetical protein